MPVSRMPVKSEAKVALVHDWLTGYRGGEKCLEALCRRFPDAPLYTLLHQPGSTCPDIERMQIETSFLQQLPASRKLYRHFLPLMPAAIESFRLPTDLDAVLSISHAVAKGIQPPPGVPHICYCLTPMRYVWHLRTQYFAGSAAGSGTGRTLRSPWSALRDRILDRIAHWDRHTNPRVTHFVAASKTVRRRIAECYGRYCPVIYPPVDTDFYTPSDVTRQDFYVCVSALVPYKRMELAIAACNRLQRRLLIIGDGPLRKRLTSLAGPTVTLLGWRSDDEIRSYYRCCRGLLFPACEDFGIVPLEAQACGAPVIALGQGGATETVIAPRPGEPGTGVFFAEQTVDSLCDAILKLEAEPRQVSPIAARRQAVRFRKQRFERELVGYLLDVIDSVRKPKTNVEPARLERMAA